MSKQVVVMDEPKEEQVVQKKEPRLNKFFFDWTKEPPYTTHPDYREKLERGLHNRVLVDGVDIGKCQRLETGNIGWVERQVYYATNPNMPVMVIKCRVDPKYYVREDMPEYQEHIKKYPFPCEVIADREGKIIHYFYSEIVTEFLIGHVEYVVDESLRGKDA